MGGANKDIAVSPDAANSILDVSLNVGYRRHVCGLSLVCV